VVHLLDLSPQQFADQLRSLGRRRAYLIYEPASRTFHPSHPTLQQLADRLVSDPCCAEAHEAIFFEVGRETGALMAAFLHRTVRGQAQGGLRNQPYETLEALLCDGLRLSRSMTHKNALAGLWWGGGKGLIARGDGDEWRDSEFRRRLYREYGTFVSSLRGCYVTAEDAGTSPLDIAEIFHTTRFLTCIPTERGGSGNPSRMTAAGVVCAMEAALRFLGVQSLADKKIVLQGAGNVGSEMIPLLLHHGVRQIVASETCEERRAALLDNFSDDPVEIRAARSGDVDILAESCDVLSPCALGGVLGPKTIPSIRATIVCGSANNQLVDEERDALALKEGGITYVPDFLANRMGIVACANEQYGGVNSDPMIQRHLGRSWNGGIYLTTSKVLDLARKPGVTPVSAAIRLAEDLARQPHPIWGHRTRQIVESLVADRWADQ
jgi:glutamate dehydrogenase/leucine dehydrogenase